MEQRVPAGVSERLEAVLGRQACCPIRRLCEQDVWGIATTDWAVHSWTPAMLVDSACVVYADITPSVTKRDAAALASTPGRTLLHVGSAQARGVGAGHAGHAGRGLGPDPTVG